MVTDIIIAFFLRCCMVKYKGVFVKTSLDINR